MLILYQKTAFYTDINHKKIVLRTARANGKKFFGCSNYPQCRNMRPVEA